MIAVGGDLEAPLSLGTNAVQLHELLHALLAHTNASGKQLLSGARPAITASRLGMDDLDVHQQCVVAWMATLGSAGQANEVLVVPGYAHLQHPALHRDGPHPPVALDEGVLHADPFAKYAVAVPRMPGSISTRANSARNRLISICSALTFTMLSAPWSLPWRCALTQLYSVWPTTPSQRAAAAMLWPASTSRTAFCLNSSVYGALAVFVIFVLLT